MRRHTWGAGLLNRMMSVKGYFEFTGYLNTTRDTFRPLMDEEKFPTP